MKGRQNLVARVLDFFNRFSQSKPSESKKGDPDSKEPTRIEINGELTEPITVGTPLKSSVDYVVEDRLCKTNIETI